MSTRHLFSSLIPGLVLISLSLSTTAEAGIDLTQPFDPTKGGVAPDGAEVAGGSDPAGPASTGTAPGRGKPPTAPGRGGLRDIPTFPGDPSLGDPDCPVPPGVALSILSTGWSIDVPISTTDFLPTVAPNIAHTWYDPQSNDPNLPSHFQDCYNALAEGQVRLGSITCHCRFEGSCTPQSAGRDLGVPPCGPTQVANHPICPKGYNDGVRVVGCDFNPELPTVELQVVVTREPSPYATPQVGYFIGLVNRVTGAKVVQQWFTMTTPQMQFGQLLPGIATHSLSVPTGKYMMQVSMMPLITANSFSFGSIVPSDTIHGGETETYLLTVDRTGGTVRLEPMYDGIIGQVSECLGPGEDPGE
ncbi:MAG: hypothetical protein AAF533_30570 [Acidobacteriota bacterium]